MAKYEKYAEYKDSGVEWLGKIPSHWECKRLKDILIEPMKNGLFKKKDQFGKGSLLVNVSDLYVSDSFILDDSLDRVETTKEEKETYRVNKGDLFFVRSSLKLEGIGRSACYVGLDNDVVFECHIVNAKPKRNEVSSKFLTRYLNSHNIINEYVRRSKTTTITTIDQNSLATISVLIPPVEEQKKLDDFLDYELNQIESLIAKQEKLIELLKEKRQAVISHAVTKGLNPDVRMKDSGVEWLGQVPEHWITMRLKDILTQPMKNGLFKKKDQFGKGSLLVNVSDLYVENNFIYEDSLDRVQTTKEECQIYKVEKGDIFFVRSSLKLEGIGRSACYMGLDDDVVFECHIVNAKINRKRVSSKFLTRYLNSQNVINEYVRRSKTTTMTTIDQNNLSTISIVIPPFEEQANIDVYLDRYLIKTEYLIRKAESAILLMQERRTALISSAVTGKIDVRNCQYPNQKNIRS